MSTAHWNAINSQHLPFTNSSSSPFMKSPQIHSQSFLTFHQVPFPTPQSLTLTVHEMYSLIHYLFCLLLVKVLSWRTVGCHNSSTHSLDHPVYLSPHSRNEEMCTVLSNLLNFYWLLTTTQSYSQCDLLRVELRPGSQRHSGKLQGIERFVVVHLLHPNTGLECGVQIAD